MLWIQNEYIIYHLSIYDRLLRHQLGDNELMKLISSILKLVWIQLRVMFGLIYILQSLCNVLMIFVYFVFNNIYKIKQINYESISLKIFIFGSRAVLFYILTHYGIIHLLYPIIKLILTTTQTCFIYVNHLCSVLCLIFEYV